MRWQERRGHGAVTCDVCHGILRPMAYGRRPVMADYELGVLVGKEERLGLLLACGLRCCNDADGLAGDDTPTTTEAQ